MNIQYDIEVKKLAIDKILIVSHKVIPILKFIKKKKFFV